jgi:hypothetical protein
MSVEDFFSNENLLLENGDWSRIPGTGFILTLYYRKICQSKISN